jgi:DNA-binding response OmpR family regulator
MRAKILVIDDEQDFIDLITHNLAGAGFEIIGAPAGIQGLHQARRHLPDIIVLDMGLPDIDGLSVCEILRKQPSTTRIPIVLVTAMSGEIARANALVSGADYFLTKPFNREDLLNCVEKTLRARDAALEPEAAAPEGARL